MRARARRSRRARGELHAYFAQLIEERRGDLTDDLVSELIRGRIDGAPLTEEQLVGYCELLVEAGNETTRNAISGGLVAFCENPGEWEKLRARTGAAPRCRGGDPALGHPDQPLHAHRDRRLRGRRREDRRRRSGGAVLRVGEPRRGGVRGSVRVPHRSPPEPAPRVRFRRARLHGRAPRASSSRRSSGTCSNASNGSSFRGRSSVWSRPSTEVSSTYRSATAWCSGDLEKGHDGESTVRTHGARGLGRRLRLLGDRRRLRRHRGAGVRARDRAVARSRRQLLRHRRGLRPGRLRARARRGARASGGTRRSSSPSSG